MGEFLVPFKGRNQPFMFCVNFLWRERNVYVMDNHRCALWCWLQETTQKDNLNLFHLDRHADVAWDWSPAALDEVRKAHPRNLRIEQYLTLKIPWGDCTRLAVANDNFLSLFLALDPCCIDLLLFGTGEGVPEEFWKQDISRTPKRVESANPWELPNRISTDLQRGARWIVDVDLDFFFCARNAEHGMIPLFSHTYVEALVSAIAEALKRDRIAVLTVSLSPGFCGGWENSERLCARLCEALGLHFGLPA